MNKTHGAFWSWSKFSMLCNNLVSLDLWTWFILDLICPWLSWSWLQYCSKFLGSQNFKSSHSCRLPIRLSQVWVQRVGFEKTKRHIPAHLSLNHSCYYSHSCIILVRWTWTFNNTHIENGIWLCVASFYQKLSFMGVSLGCVLGLSFEMMNNVADDCIRRKDYSASHILHPMLVFSYNLWSSVPHST